MTIDDILNEPDEEEPYQGRRCPTCLKPIVKHPDETMQQFKKRRYCNRSCSNKSTHRHKGGPKEYGRSQGINPFDYAQFWHS